MFGTSEPKLHPLETAYRENLPSIVASVSPARLRKDVASLNYPHNRLHSPAAMLKAEEFIVSAFHDAGWEMQRHPFFIKQVRGFLDYGDYRATIYPELAGVNLVAFKPGEQSDDALMVEAHYDTAFMSPGADDNTASVTALLELARILKPYKFKNALMLIACDMEELGFIGATQLAKELSIERQLKGAIVLETLAYSSREPRSQSVPPGFGLIYPDQTRRLKRRAFKGNNTVVIYHNIARSLAVSFSESLNHIAGADASMLLRAPGDIPLLGRALRIFLFSLIKQFYRADHYPFLLAKIPAIQITDTANFRNPHYHRNTDSPDTLDYERLANIVAALAITIQRMNGYFTI